ncbi:MAG: RNA degradosome polyphosphate kinase, partial [Psychrobacter sp.]|nr:RNA degradosome polyphosphate kinase [Psychrobacter sp.]
MNKQNNSSDKNSSNKGSHVDDIVDVSNVVHEIDNSEDLTEIKWQRSEDGSYSPSSYINRELSLLQFQLRVLAQAASPRHPLLERLFFLIIFSSNLDEFFEIRVAGIMQKLNIGDVSSNDQGM